MPIYQYDFKCIKNYYSYQMEPNKSVESLWLTEIQERKKTRAKMFSDLNMTEKEILAVKNSLRKSKIHEKNMTFHVETKFIEAGIDLSYIDKIIEHFRTKSGLTTKMRSIVLLNRPIFQILCDDPKLKNCLELGNYDYKQRKDAEENLFVNAYLNSEPHERPKYGSVNFRNDFFGDPLCKCYGDITIIYDESIKYRTSFIYGDSFGMMKYICTYDHLKHILFHIPISDINKMISIIDHGTECTLTSYIEAQIHGKVDLGRDVQRIIIPEAVYKTQKQYIENFQAKYPKPEIVVQK